MVEREILGYLLPTLQLLHCGSDAEETIVPFRRMVGAQVVELLRCEARPSCHVLHGSNVHLLLMWKENADSRLYIKRVQALA